jgi:hypothetical protein
MNTKTKTTKETDLKSVLIDFIYILGFAALFIFTLVSIYNK